jgi:hypothetical protein
VERSMVVADAGRGEGTRLFGSGILDGKRDSASPLRIRGKSDS